MKKLAIIIPGYNCEKYISVCINSILTQDFKDYTVFFIDDGSTDSTKSIVTAIQDARLKYIYQTNSGVSIARNNGLLQARDFEYVMFIDADDWLEKGALNIIITSIVQSQHADYLLFDWNKYRIRDGESECIRCKIDDRFKHNLTRNDLLKHFARSRSGGSPWGKLFKNEIIQKNNLKFKEGLPYAEDYLFNIAFIKCSNTVFYSPKTIYGYNCYQIGARAKFRKNLIDIFIEIENEKKDLLLNYRKELKDYVLAEELEQLTISIQNLNHDSFSKQEKKCEKKKAYRFLEDRNIGLADIIRSETNIKVKMYVIIFRSFMAIWGCKNDINQE